MIDLYSFSTPNGKKIALMLEACGLPYRYHSVNFFNNEQFAPDFLAISPNNKIPAIVDHDGFGGETISVFESGAILIYLAEKTGKFLPSAPRARIEVLQWLMFQMGGFGPMLGQANHFVTYAPEPVPYALKRYTDEALRLYGVLDRRLATQAGFVVGDAPTIADFALFPWADRHEVHATDITAFPHVTAWHARMGELPYSEEGMRLRDK